MAAIGQCSDFLSRYRQEITNLLNAREELVGLFRQYNELGYATVLADSDFDGINQGITADEFNKAVNDFNTLDGLLTSGGTIGGGCGTALYRLKLGV